MHLELENTPCEAHLHSHLSQATARDAVSSSQTDTTLSRSHLSTGIVDERQTYVWPEFYESAQTRVMSPSRAEDCSRRGLVSDWRGQLDWTSMSQSIPLSKRQQATAVLNAEDIPYGNLTEHVRDDRLKDGAQIKGPTGRTRDLGSTRVPFLESTQLPCDPSSSSASTSLRGSTGSQSLSVAQRQVLHLLQCDQMDRLMRNLVELAKNHDGLELAVLSLCDRTDRLEEAVQRNILLQEGLEKTQGGYEAGTAQRAATSSGSIH